MSEELNTQPQQDVVSVLDTKIIEVANKTVEYLNEDRQRAEDVFEEIRELFENGETRPDDKRELNNAQAMAQQVTDNMIKLVTALVRVRVGESKVQIANINDNSGGEGSGGTKALGAVNREKLIDLVEAAFKAKQEEQQ